MTQHSSTQGMQLGLVLDTTEGALQGKTPTFQELQELALAAERAGVDSLWLCDHLLSRFPGQEEQGIWEVFTVLSALAAVTTRITLGTIVACTSFRPPALVAKMADTIDEISQGRFILGLGAGWHQPEYAAFGYPFDHLASHFDEAIQIIIPLLREGKVDFQGKYYQVENCVLRPRGPSHAGPQILIAGRRPRMLRLTAQYADSWNTAWHVDTAVVKERYEEFKNVCVEVGRSTIPQLTVGTEVRLSSAGEQPTEGKAITGSPEKIAHQLRRFADEDTAHLIVALDQLSIENIEQFGEIARLVREQ